MIHDVRNKLIALVLTKCRRRYSLSILTLLLVLTYHNYYHVHVMSLQYTDSIGRIVEANGLRLMVVLATNLCVHCVGVCTCSSRLVWHSILVIVNPLQQLALREVYELEQKVNTCALSVIKSGYSSNCHHGNIMFSK